MSKDLNESFIYFETKRLLAQLDWTIVAGEPSGGSDHLPRIEIRDPSMNSKGSKGSYKVDLIATKSKNLLLVEAKINFDLSDVEKLNVICNERKEHLRSALQERLGLNLDEYHIIKSLSLRNIHPEQVPPDFVCFVIGGAIIHPELLPKD